MSNNAAQQPTILDKITTQRRVDVEAAKAAVPLDEIKRLAATSPFPITSFVARLKNGVGMAVMAEVKRASPSKGDIAPNIDAPSQGLAYAKAGVSAISCLTEPHWFKGTLEDLRGIRMAIDSMEDRPALLRKDFLIDEYQIYEARAYGADTVLLIVASLEETKLRQMVEISRSLGMEPLVEVNTDAEMEIALHSGAKVIGINNRNLHSFQVDMETTNKLLKGHTLSEDVIVAALSGITSRADVEHFEKAGARAVLVGEALMRTSNPAQKILELQGFLHPIIKICGIKSVEMAICAAEAGAHMIGLVFAESKRRVDIALAKEIVSAVRSWRTSRHGDRGNNDDLRDAPSDNDNTNATTNTIKTYQSLAKGLRLHVGRTGPLVVGVFANNSVEQVNLIANEVGLDYVQLSGHEGFAAVQQIAHPCIRAIHVGGAVSANSALKLIEPGPNAILLDTMDPCGALGGTGRAFSWDIAVQLSQQQVPFFLAGGLTIDNVKAAILKTRPFGIDVSSGVEENGEKSANKIHRFIEQAMLKQTNPL